MLIKEYRVILPMTVEEYQVAQLWSVAKSSKENTGGGEGIVVLKNEPFNNKTDLFENYISGQYTEKIYKLQSKVPWWVRKLAPKGSLELHEEAWNAYPYCKTVIDNPDYMKENFFIRIESLHVQDDGSLENPFNLSKDQLKKREIINIDIANDTVAAGDYAENEDPTKFLSQKTGRGQLKPNWKQTTKPIMCAYKLVSVEFKWFGFQGRIENFIQTSERRLFTKFHRQLFCWIDEWHGLTMDDIRKIEEQVQKELSKEIKEGVVKGYVSNDE
ncbi:phosphatidylinositol transfer alpha isoform isoform X2 [Brachionus plicatilis]|uniref:Phosphatidylinositol transfer alpha isoform isoform X2 n=1 Tax=Brachionus plicatilis TaxID=10195 RepID=A0A3M7P771_BRAPC|nr:phosphatidylinositol transfer alpha isoform isoform X2 [Brachionus plicatilis]